MVALAFEVDEGCYQISTHLASKIDDASVSKLSLVYDLSSIYLFDGTEYIWLEDSLATISSRLPLKESAMTRDINLFDMCDLSKTEPLGYYTSPLYASFRYEENPTKGHAGTIYGVNVISGFMMVMDPSFGSATMTTKDGTTYSYICEKNGKVLNLYRGVCYSHNW